MSKFIYEYEDGEMLTSLSDNMAMDSEGDMYMRMSDNMSMNMSTGELHMTSTWEDEEYEEDDY